MAYTGSEHRDMIEGLEDDDMMKAVLGHARIKALHKELDEK